MMAMASIRFKEIRPPISQDDSITIVFHRRRGYQIRPHFCQVGLLALGDNLDPAVGKVSDEAVEAKTPGKSDHSRPVANIWTLPVTRATSLIIERNIGVSDIKPLGEICHIHIPFLAEVGATFSSLSLLPFRPNPGG
jgi:hypothetical protein